MRHIYITLFSVAVLLSAGVSAEMASDADFVKETYQNNLKEHAMAGLAGAKASDARVKEFASMLSKEHLQANDDIKVIAKRMNVELPDFKDEKASFDKLADLNGSDFDLAFINWTVDSHQKELARFEAEQKVAKRDLKGFVDAHIPEIKSHLEAARSLSSNLNKGALRDVPVNHRIDANYDPERVFNDEVFNPKTPKDSDMDRSIPPMPADEMGHEMKEFGRNPKFDTIDKWK